MDAILIFYSYLYIHYFWLGAFVPLTKNGNIVVDGVLASCYASFDHDLAHFEMMPLQWFSQTMPLSFADDDLSTYMMMIKKLGRFILPPGHFW